MVGPILHPPDYIAGGSREQPALPFSATIVNRYVLLSSPQTRAELAAVLARPQIRRLAMAPLDALFRGIERDTWHVPGALDLSGA